MGTACPNDRRRVIIAVMTYILFPGRHHVLTRFQAGYLRSIAADATVVWAVTSANHGNT